MNESLHNPNTHSVTRRRKLLAAGAAVVTLAGAAVGVVKMQDNDQPAQNPSEMVKAPISAPTTLKMEAQVPNEGQLTLVEAQRSIQSVVDVLTANEVMADKLSLMMNKRIVLTSKNPNHPTRTIEIDSPIITSRTEYATDVTLNNKFFSAVIMGEDKKPQVMTFSPDEYNFRDAGAYEKTGSGFRRPELSMNEAGLQAITTDLGMQTLPVAVLRVISE